MVFGSQSVKKAEAEGGFEVAALSPTTHVGYRTRAVDSNYGLDFGGDFIEGLVPGYSFETGPYVF
jgi:hypothetical protein